MDAAQATPRARAAWAYSCLKNDELAEKADMHPDRLRAILGPSNTKDVRLEELYAIADACGVPNAFMDLGFEALSAKPSLEELAAQVAALHEAVRLLQFDHEVAELEEQRRDEEDGPSTGDPPQRPRP